MVRVKTLSLKQFLLVEHYSAVRDQYSECRILIELNLLNILLSQIFSNEFIGFRYCSEFTVFYYSTFIVYS